MLISFATFNLRIGFRALSCFHCSGLHADYQNAPIVSLLYQLLYCLERDFARVFFVIYLEYSSRRHNRIQNRFG